MPRIAKPRYDTEPVNYLMKGVPEEKASEFYHPEKDEKEVFGEVWGT